MIVLSAYREKEEPWRIARLKLLRDLIEYHDLGAKVRALHDHKGRLSVDWKEGPSFRKRWNVSVIYGPPHFTNTTSTIISSALPSMASLCGTIPSSHVRLELVRPAMLDADLLLAGMVVVAVVELGTALGYGLALALAWWLF